MNEEKQLMMIKSKGEQRLELIVGITRAICGVVMFIYLELLIWYGIKAFLGAQ